MLWSPTPSAISSRVRSRSAQEGLARHQPIEKDPVHNDPTQLTITVEEASALRGVSRSTAYALASTGELPTIRLRRRILVPINRMADLLSASPLEVQVAMLKARRQADSAKL